MSNSKQRISRLETMIQQMDEVLADPKAGRERKASAERVRRGAALLLEQRKQREYSDQDQNVLGKGLTKPELMDILPISQQETSGTSGLKAEIRSLFFDDSYVEGINILDRNDQLWRQAENTVQNYIKRPLPWYYYVGGLFIGGSFAAKIAFGGTPSFFGEFSLFAFSLAIGLWITYDKQMDYKMAVRDEYWRLEKEVELNG